MNDKVVESVCEDLKKRSELGFKKYGTTLDRKDLDLRDWLQHAYEECLDQANYLKKAITDLENTSLRIEKGSQITLNFPVGGGIYCVRGTDHITITNIYRP